MEKKRSVITAGQTSRAQGFQSVLEEERQNYYREQGRRTEREN